MSSTYGAIFINYRKADSNWNALALYNELQKYFQKEQLFKDFNTMHGGDDFVVSIENALQKCDVLLVIIGKEWIDIKNSAGFRRLDLEDDFVRLEIATALGRNIRVIPVLFDNTPMPESHELPDNLKMLSRRQSVEIDNKRFEDDVRKLVTEINRGLKPAADAPVQGAAAPPPTFGTPPTSPYQAPPASPPTYQAPSSSAKPKPNNNLVWGILTTIFCCLPLGIPAIIAASKVDSLYALGKYEEALEQSVKARKWSLYACITGVVVWIIYFIVIISTQR